MSDANGRWSFWLDVGGTFTDCLALRPDGELLRRKVLSSSRVKGRGTAVLDASSLIDAARCGEPADFWRGYTLRLLDDRGQLLHETLISESSSAGTLRFEQPRDEGLAYEIISPEPAPILAIRQFLGLRLDEVIPPCDVKLGTTKGTNALLTRTGARTAFLTTRGFGDLLRIGYQNRPKLFERTIHKIEPLHEVSLEIDERLAADGSVLLPLDVPTTRAVLQSLRDCEIESLAICLMHAWKNPQHELLLEQLAREAGFREISVSHRVSPGMKIVPRGDTTLVDAYLTPVLRDYVNQLERLLPGSDLRLLTSAGSLVRAANFSGKDSVLSGPAGGVTGFARAAEAAGFTQAIGFDMGGTSTDVARYAGRFAMEYETQKAGVRLVTPMLAVETVAAGGGSICRWDGVKLVVGPASAGADPGPACYGRGGPLTITDCNFFLGRIVPEHFPFPLDRAAVERQLAEVQSALPRELATNYSLDTLAAGFVQIANALMAAAIRSVSIARGYDVRDDLLVAFGAAAAQHACGVARQLGMKQILSHPDAGVLSALGIGLADVIKHQVTPLYRDWDASLQEELPAIFAALLQQGREALADEGVDSARMEFVRELDLRYAGTDVPLTIREPDDGDWLLVFAAEHQQRYGYVQAGRGLVVAAARVTATGRSKQIRSGEYSHTSAPHPGPLPGVPGRRSSESPIIRREDLQPGVRIVGPAIVVEPLTTTIIDAGWQATMLSGGELLLEDVADEANSTDARAEQDFSTADPVLLEIFNQQFTAIATQMGHTLRNTSVSVNVKERLDFSCAIFTAAGDLVVNAPHIPVHLGAMSETVKSVLRDCQPLAPGDVVVTNDPYRGGSHLPDVTVVTPVFDAAGQLLFFTASRAHHAEIGGITPGSMPPFSKCLAEEGVLIRNFKVLAAGLDHFAELATLLTSGTYPSRAVEHNLADIRAQLAANQQGANELLELVARQSLAMVRAYMEHIRAAAETKMRQAIDKLGWHTREFIDHLDDGTRIMVTVTAYPGSRTIGFRPLHIDFTGTSGVHAGNLNANTAIVTAAVLYVLRLLIDEDIPLNQGVLAPVQLTIPPGLLNPPASERPEDCPAIVGGNVETSQRVVDVLLAAFDLAAASQGTMNNLLFGDATFGYYETICGGSGATADGHGAHAVQTHMTNTRITDPEVLEHRFPVRLQRFSINLGSGGNGRQRGGDGVIRQIQFLQPMTVSLLTQRRDAYRPFGLHDGEPGARGKNELCRQGQTESLAGAAQFAVDAGDTLTIQTPGGGGWGDAWRVTNSPT